MSVLAVISARVRVLSIESLTEYVWLPLEGIGWVILGGMSGPKYRCHVLRPEWAQSVCDRCLSTGTTFFFNGGMKG